MLVANHSEQTEGRSECPAQRRLAQQDQGLLAGAMPGSTRPPHSTTAKVAGALCSYSRCASVTSREKHKAGDLWTNAGQDGPGRGDKGSAQQDWQGAPLPSPCPCLVPRGCEGPASRCTARVRHCGALHGATKGRWWSVGQSQSWPGDMPRAPGRGARPWHCSSPARSPRKTPLASTVLIYTPCGSSCQPGCISTACCVVWRP